MRRLRRETYIRLKAATRRLVEKCGGIEAAGRETRVSFSRLSDYQSQSDSEETAFIPLDIIADLEDASGELTITEALASIHGAVLLRLPVRGDGVTTAHIASVCQETGEVIQGIGTALSDGKIDAREREKVLVQVDDAQRALLGLRAHLVAMGKEVEAK